jgi:glycosyltransferase involved in cell wall biosynthesis
MPSHIPERPDFLMITDTAMVRKNGQMYAFGPVVRELEVFQELFRSVEWIGFERPELAEDPIMMPVPSDVHCILLRPSGGNFWVKKIGVLFQVPLMLRTILKSMRGKKVIHTRAPSVPAFIAALLSVFFQKKIWWHKYAGNWGEPHPPFFYGLQRSWLTRAHWSKVTINGRWPGQPAHCLSFENPCLTGQEQRTAAASAEHKSFHGPLHVCFVGNLSHFKGITALVESLALLPEGVVGTLRIAGDGPARRGVEALIARHGWENTVQLLGFQSRQQLNKLYEDSHILVLPSASEGFPKVVAEAAAYGCVSLVSDVSAIGQYIVTGVNGHLLQERSPEAIASAMLQLSADRAALKKMSLAAMQLTERFTYEHFSERIVAHILPINN